jgi:hypothetical protein
MSCGSSMLAMILSCPPQRAQLSICTPNSENVHWLSDSVAGAALGIATARFVLNRQEAQDRAALQFQPVKNGWLISYSVRTH